MAVLQKFTGYSLRWQICSLAAIALIVSIVVMGWLAFDRSRELVKDMTVQKMQAQSDAVVGNIESEIERLRSDVTAVPTFPPIPGILRTVDNRVNPGQDPVQIGSTTSIWIDRLAQIIRAQIRSYPERIEYAVYDEHGQGIMKVVRLDGEAEAELIVDEIAPVDNQNLYLRSIQLNPGQVYFTTSIEKPEGAADTKNKFWIYASTPYFVQRQAATETQAEGNAQAEGERREPSERRDGGGEDETSGRARGVFVIKVDGNRLLDEAFHAIDRHDDRFTSGRKTAFEMIDQDMRFLYTNRTTSSIAERTKTFDELRPYRANLLRMRRDDQYDRKHDRFGAIITSKQRGGDVSLIATHQRIFFNEPEDADRFWVIALSTTANDALAAINQLAFTYLSVGVIVCGLALLFLFWVASKLTASLSRLSRSADTIAAGNLDAVIADSGAIGEVGVLEASFRKMTAHLQALLAKAEQQTERTDAIFNATADGLITINEDGHVTWFNTSAERLFGYSSQEIVGQNISVLAAPPHGEQHDQYLQRYYQGGQTHVIGQDRQLEAVRKDGTVFPISLRVSELRRDGERLFIGLVQDITHRKELEAERVRLFDAIGDAVQRLTSTTQEILATTTEQAAGAEQQAASISEVVATADEIAQSASQAALRADEVAESAQHTDQVGLTGLGAIEQSTAAMDNVKTQVESIANRILSLAESAQQIGDITDAVHEIAEQTNILALNAAVEASRAGEHGKGFAVVAAEVKNLAQESKKATTQVASILSDIQKATHAAVLSTEKGTHTVNEASKIIAEAGQTIHSLAATLAQSAQTATHISETANQQAAAVGQLTQGIRNIDTVTHQSVQAIKQIEAAAQNLAALSDELAELTQQRSEVHV